MTDQRPSKAPRPVLRARARLSPSARRAAEARRRRTYLLVTLAVVTTLAGLGIGSAVALGGRSARAAGPAPRLSLGPISALGPLRRPPAQGPTGPEGIPIPSAPLLTNAAGSASGATVGGVSCDTNEQVVYHIHVHLTVFVDGRQRRIPGGIGILAPEAELTPQGAFVASGSCFYWLHTHAADGIIHVESPTRRTYSLGQFFDIWGQPLSRARVGAAKGTVVAIYNGRHYLGDPRDIPLTPHANVQLDVGSPLVGPVSVASWGRL